MSSAVRITGLQILVAAVILAGLIHAAECAISKDICSAENCVSGDKCDQPIIGGFCRVKSETCCSILKSEYRTLCRHHGGECMKTCAAALQRASTDCPAGTTCCVLV